MRFQVPPKTFRLHGRITHRRASDGNQNVVRWIHCTVWHLVTQLDRFRFLASYTYTMAQNSKPLPDFHCLAVEFECKRSSRLLSVGIKYSTRDLIVTCVWNCDICKISVYDTSRLFYTLHALGKCGEGRGGLPVMRYTDRHINIYTDVPTRARSSSIYSIGYYTIL